MHLFFLLLCLIFTYSSPLMAHTTLKLPSNISKLSLKDPAVLQAYEIWNTDASQKLIEGSEIANTAVGPIEYSLLLPSSKRESDFKPRRRPYSDGERDFEPVVLVLHGGFGGYDQAELIGKNLVKQGFSVLCPSRPGYLRTPLFVGKTNAEQADAMAALLDTLHIDRVAVLGFSAGSQVAFEFATRYPKRTWALVLESLGAQPSQSAEYELLTEILELTGEDPVDFGSFLVYLSTILQPYEAVNFILKNDNTLTSSKLKKRMNFVLGYRRQFKFCLDFIRSALPLGPRVRGILNDIGANLDPWYDFQYDLLKAPTLIIAAKDDSNGSYSEAKWVADQIDCVEFVKVNFSGHFIWLGPEAKEWNKSLNAFLDKYNPCKPAEELGGWITGADG